MRRNAKNRQKTLSATVSGFCLPAVLALLPYDVAHADHPFSSAATQADTGDKTTDATQVADRTEQLRIVLATDMADAAAHIAPEELRTVTAAFGPAIQDRDVLASWLMRGGLTAATDANLSGIYNPLADAWLVLGWRTIGGSPHVVWAALLQGDVLRPRGQPDWLESRSPVDGELQRVKRQSFAALADLPGGLGTDGLVRLAEDYRGAEGRLVLARARAMVGALAGWGREHADTLASVRAAVRRGNDAALRAVPDKTRESLSPMALLTGPQGALLVLQSPRAPAQVLLVRAAGSHGRLGFAGLDLSAQIDGGTPR